MIRILIKQNHCDFCGTCVAVCPQDAIELDEAQWILLPDRCTACGRCVHVCPLDALELNNEKQI
jgi:ferredoxin